MKAYVLQAPESLKVIEKEVPVPGEQEVLVRISHVGICGSDLHLYKGTYSGPTAYPILFGHEWVGTVVATGAKAEYLKPGDKVTGDCSKYCGECPNCQVDKNLCQNIEKFGITLHGSSAEYIVREAKYLYKAPQELDPELIALTEPLAVSAHLVNKIARLTKGLAKQRVLIFGAGAIGLGVLLILKKKYRCAYVEAADLMPHRINLARELGAQVYEAPDKDISYDESRYDFLYTHAFYDVIIDTTGNSEVFQKCLELVKPAGIIGCLGMAPQVTMKQKLIVMKALTITGSIGGTGDFPEVLTFIKENQTDVRKLISHRFPMEQAQEAFLCSENQGETLKMILALNGRG